MNVFKTGLLLLAVGTSAVSTPLRAQNNAIFYGGAGDGHSLGGYSQQGSGAQFAGGLGDGFAQKTYAQASNLTLYTGGEGDGFGQGSYNQPGSETLFAGGLGDGFSFNTYNQAKPLPMYNGGIGDGYSFTPIPVAPLPVRWLSFTGAAVREGHRLEWQVAGREAGTRFELQHSANGQHFTGIYEATAAGEKNPETFHFFNTHPTVGNNYYRVQSVEKNGGITYSSVVLLRLAGPGRSLVIFPNPAATVLQVSLQGYTPDGDVTTRILDVTGRVVATYRFAAAAGPLTVDVAALVPGKYLLQVLTGDQTEVVPFLKGN